MQLFEEGNDLVIYALKVQQPLQNDLFAQILQYVGKDKRARINRLKAPQEAELELFAELLVRFLVMQKFSIPNQSITFSKNEFGKPFVKEISHFHFNVSHSRKWIVCAVDVNPVGVDIEYIDSIDLNTAKDFFSEEEIKTLFEKQKSEQLPYFYTLWTLKESYIKFIGKGLHLPLKDFTMTVDNGNHAKCVVQNKMVDQVYFTRLSMDPDYKMAVCASNPCPAEPAVFLDQNKIYQHFQP